MPEEKKLTAAQAHQYFAVESNNKTWDLLEKADRTKAEEIEMIHQAHTSSYHWSKVGEPVNQVRAHYLVAKVYFALDMVESAYYWAQKTGPGPSSSGSTRGTTPSGARSWLGLTRLRLTRPVSMSFMPRPSPRSKVWGKRMPPCVRASWGEGLGSG